MENTKKLTGKELINVGIYTAMTLVIFFVVGLLTALPVVYPFLFLIWPIVCGIPMMLYYTKIKKFGMLTILLLTNRQYKTATVFFCLFAAGLFVQAIQNSVQFPMIVNMLVVLLVGLVLRLFPAFVMGAYIIKSTTASECITALGRMHIGRQITIPLSVLFRFIPTMQEESAAIKDAMRMREVQFGTKKFWQNPAALIEYRFIPLMISVVKIGDDLSAAALTRGLDNPVRRTNITKVGFTAWDLLAVLIAGTALLSTYFFSPW